MHAEEASSKNVEQNCKEPQAQVGIQCENPGSIELGAQGFFPYPETLKLPLDQEHSAFWYQDLTLSSTNLLGCIYSHFSHVQPLGCSLNLPDLDG